MELCLAYVEVSIWQGNGKLFSDSQPVIIIH